MSPEMKSFADLLHFSHNSTPAGRLTVSMLTSALYIVSMLLPFPSGMRSYDAHCRRVERNGEGGFFQVMSFDNFKGSSLYCVPVSCYARYRSPAHGQFLNGACCAGVSAEQMEAAEAERSCGTSSGSSTCQLAPQLCIVRCLWLLAIMVFLA